MGYGPEAIAESTVMIIICVLSIFGNSSLFIVVFTNRNLRTISNYYVLSLASADLLVSLVSGPVTAVSMLKQEWPFGEIACTAFGFITLLTFVASVNNLAMIALNRFFFIVRWKYYKNIFNRRRALLFGVCTWCFSIALSVPPLIGWSNISFIPEKSYCFVHWPSDSYYMYFMVIICFCGPLIIMLISYYKILSFTRELKKKLHTPKYITMKKTFLRREARMVSPEETKLTNTLLIVVACFVACWAPFAVTMFFDVYHPNPIPRYVQVGSLLLGYLNSMCNPIVYGIRNTSFRRGFKHLYAQCLPCLLKSEISSYFNNSAIDSDSKYKVNPVDNSKSSEKKEEIPDLESKRQPMMSFNCKITPSTKQDESDFLPGGNECVSADL